MVIHSTLLLIVSIAVVANSLQQHTVQHAAEALANQCIRALVAL